jgi:anti-sigma-K factor RskA
VDPKEYISSGIIESYVLGLASVEEGEEFERMCAAHSEIRIAREQFEQQLEQNAIALGLAPPNKLKSLVLSEIEIDAQKSGKVSTTQPQVQEQTSRPPRIGANAWKYTAVAAIILLAFSTFFNLRQYSQYQNEYAQIMDTLASGRKDLDQMRRTLHNVTMTKMMKDTNMTMVKMTGVKQHWGMSAMVFWDKRTKEVYLMADSLPKPPSGMQYQLWAIVNGKAVNVGLLNWENENMMNPLKAIPTAEAFAITLEKAGGSAWPTEESMYVMGNT